MSKGELKMPEIVKVCKEHQPALRFIGKLYTDADRENGGFGHKWGEWFQNGWFDTLEKLGNVEDIENGYLGFMRCYPDFEYWIGMFMPPGTAAPEGYGFVDLEEGDVGICWIKGEENDGAIYGMHGQCLERLRENGMSEYRADDTGRAFFFERYNCPRFTEKDNDGSIILDYGIYLKD
jgi:hypothetical protein